MWKAPRGGRGAAPSHCCRLAGMAAGARPSRERSAGCCAPRTHAQMPCRAAAALLVAATAAAAHDAPSPAVPPAAHRVGLRRQGCGFAELEVASSGHVLRIEDWGADSLRVRAVPAASLSFRDDLPSALVPQPPPHSSDSSCGRLTSASVYTNGNLRAEVGADGLLSFHRVSDGKQLLTERRRAFSPSAAASPTSGPLLRLQWDLALSPGEQIFGLGQHQTGSLDNVNRTFEFSPRNTEIMIPIAHSSRGHSFLFNIPSFVRERISLPMRAQLTNCLMPWLSINACLPACLPAWLVRAK